MGYEWVESGDRVVIRNGTQLVTTLRVVTSDGQANEERHNTPRDGTVDDHDEKGDMRRRGARECD